MKLAPRVMAAFSIGCALGSLWSYDSSFVRLSSSLTNPTRINNIQIAFVPEASTTHDPPPAGEAETHNEPVVVETDATHAPVTGKGRNDHEAVIGELVRRGRFSVSLEQTLSERGLNIMTPLSGCHFAAWVFLSGGSGWKFIDCKLVTRDVLGIDEYHVSQQLDNVTAQQIQSYDTIFVNIKGLQDFVETILPNIFTPFVLITAQYHYVIAKIPAETEAALLNSSCIARIFAHNLGVHFHQSHHPKLAPFALGMTPLPGAIKGFSEAFLRLQHDTSNSKVKGIMHGYISGTNPKRNHVPSGPKLNYTEYYDEIARHRFILSPDGVRPECYRTYEAIGLGTVPITELPADLYRHLQPAPVLYEASDWNISEAEALERLGLAHFPTVNRMMIMEEYWLDYIQREMAGRDLRWFDRISLRKAKLDDFQSLS